jgi:hypothetical protein
MTQLDRVRRGGPPKPEVGSSSLSSRAAQSGRSFRHLILSPEPQTLAFLVA